MSGHVCGIHAVRNTLSRIQSLEIEFGSLGVEDVGGRRRSRMSLLA